MTIYDDRYSPVVTKAMKVFNDGMSARRAAEGPRFAEVSCSQCGETFGPGDSGFSHCDQHQEYRIVCTGSRYTLNDGPVDRVMDAYRDRYGARLHVAAGGMRGIDTLVERWAKRRCVRFTPFAVDHALDGAWPSAGPRRNQRMHDTFHPHEVVAFPGGKGTASMKAIARRAGTIVSEVP